MLENHAHLAADFIDFLHIIGEFNPVHDDLALLMLLQPVDAADHRRLTGAGRPADNDFFAPLNTQVDVFQDMEIPIPFVHPDNLDGNIALFLAHGSVAHTSALLSLMTGMELVLQPDAIT